MLIMGSMKDGITDKMIQAKYLASTVPDLQ